MVTSHYTIGSLDTGLRLLLLFLERDSVSVSEASAELGVGRSTAHRALSTLQERGFVSLHPTGRRYIAGPALVEIGRPRLVDPRSRLWIRPVIERAAELASETVHSVVLLGSQALVLDGRESEQALRVGLRTGLIRPAYATSAGKLLLSRLSPGLVRTLYPDEELLRPTFRTIATRSALLEELKRIAESDFAVSYGESENEINAVAVLLTGETWRDRVAIMASVPAHRGTEADLHRIAANLRAAATTLTQRF